MEHRVELHRIKAVLFDMDGLLLDTERLAREAWFEAARELGFSFSAELYSQLVGKTRIASRKIIEEHFGPAFDYDKVRARRTAFFHETILRDGIPLKDGALDLLSLLQRNGVPTMVTTSTFRHDALGLLQKAQLLVNTEIDEHGFFHSSDEFFRGLTAGDEVTRGKPAPDIFLLGASRLKVPAEHCLVLEDSPAGAEGALSANMQVVVVPDLVHPSEELKERVHGVSSTLNQVHRLFLEGR